MLTDVGLHCCSSRFDRCNPMGFAPERDRRFPNSRRWHPHIPRIDTVVWNRILRRHRLHSSRHRFRLHPHIRVQFRSGESKHCPLRALSIMAPDMLGGVLPVRDSPCPASAWREKAYAYVVLHSHQRLSFTYIKLSISHGCGVIVCSRPNLPICCQHTHLSRNPWQD